MRTAYNETSLHNLSVIKETKRWKKQEIISDAQMATIRTTYPVDFYHPNIMIRVLLFIATLVGLSGVTGLFALALLDAFEHAIAFLSLVYGLGSFVFLEFVIIKNNRHYKSGVSEALLYHSIGYTIAGVAGMAEFESIGLLLATCVIVFSFAAYRYADLVSTVCAILSLGGFVFNIMYEAGGVFQMIIPFGIIIVFTPLYFVFKKLKHAKKNEPWENALVLLEALSLLFVYAASNYFVVRELSIDMMGLTIEEGGDIPFAYVFYFLTAAIPVAWLYFGIKLKDLVLIRVSLVTVAFSVFTFKYYFSLGHPEITLTLSGLVLLGSSIWLLRFLKTPKNGYTREELLEEKWAGSNLQAFVISQTMGGNQVDGANSPQSGGGGHFSGGGSTDKF